MFKKVAEFYRDQENRGLVADLLKTAGWLMLFFNRTAAEAWAEAKIRLLKQNGKINDFIGGVGGFLKTGIIQTIVVLLFQLMSWTAVVMVLSFLGEGNQKSGAIVAVSSLMIAFVVEVGLLLQAIKAHAAAELSIAAVKVLRGTVNTVTRTLPSVLRFNWGTATEETLSGIRGIAMIPYKAMFWLGMINVALTTIVCLHFRVYYGAIQAATLLNFALAGLGLKVGYDLRSTVARDWSFRLALLTLVTGFVIVAIGPQNIASWWSTKSIATLKEEMLYDQRKAELAEAAALVKTTNGKMTDDQRAEYDWLMNGGLNKGPRPAPAVPKTPTCADGLDNNNDGSIDENDRACGTVDRNCITGYEVAYVKGEDGKPVVGEDGKKKVASRKPRLADGCRMFEGEDVPRRYDSRLGERDMPKPSGGNQQAHASNGGGSSNGGNRQAAAAPQAPSRPAGTKLGEEALKIAREEGWMQ